MNWRTIRTIAQKDLNEARQNRAAWIPALVVPIIFVVVLPLVIILLPQLAPIPMDALNAELDQLPLGQTPALAETLAGLDPLQTWIVLMMGYLFAPMFLILPLMLASIVGAESFVGEKERKTIEALLYTPASDGELFVGKTIAAVAPAITLGWGCFLAYAVVVNAAAWPVMGRIWFPTAPWWPLMLWVAPAVAVMSLALTVLISTRVNTFMEAYQLSATLVLLVLALVVGQATGALYLSVGVTLLIGLAFWAVAALLIWISVRTFSRSALLARI